MLLTVTALDGTTDPELVEALDEVVPVTSTEMSVTQTAPLPFQTLTCNVCQPLGAATGPSM